ncbi:MAG: PQQ-binding-like beta-propeller repeat protein [Pirellulales bacterium]|nr:PQQ-binding-like beta-propeller repeat protein [Pirellulales bacterium]
MNQMSLTSRVRDTAVHRVSRRSDRVIRLRILFLPILTAFCLVICGSLPNARRLIAQQVIPVRPQRVQGVVNGVQLLPQENQPGVIFQVRPQLATSSSGRGLTFPEDRVTLRNLRFAQQMVSEGNFTDAVALLGSILERDEDFFFRPESGGDTRTSIKAEVRRLIGQLPPEGREAYRLRFGESAASRLRESIDANDMEALTHVASTFFHTEAGYDATYLLGQQRLDHGQPLAAALAFGQLLKLERKIRDRYEPALSLRAAIAWSQAGMEAKALAALDRLRLEQPNTMVDLAGQSTPLPASEEQLGAWLAAIAPLPTQSVIATADQWGMFRGDPSRNAQAAGGMPILNKQWEARSADNVSGIESLLTELQKQNSQQAVPLLPASHPICVNSTYIFRSPLELVAVDAHTGKRLWMGARDKEIQKLLDTGQTSPTPRVGGPVDSGGFLKLALAQRMWSDLTFGTISSDGHNVYCVEELTVSSPHIYPTRGRGRLWIGNPGAGPAGTAKVGNRLRAYGLQNQGKLTREWPVGYDDDPLAGAFFLGPPLPLGDALYVLAELGGKETHGTLALVALDPQAKPDESVLWMQTLGAVEQSIALSPMRRIGGFSPSFAEGVLVCPTGSGAIIGFDLVSRSLLWGYSYDSKPSGIAQFQDIFGNAQYPGGGASLQSWVDNSVTIVAGKILCAPQDSDRLHCIDLMSGESAWGETRVQREGSRYVAGVVDDTVLLVGTRAVRSVSLEAGQVLWQHQLPDQRFPAGRGFFHDDKYHLPLAVNDVAGNVSGEIAVIDLRLRTLHVPEDQRENPARVALGNLICYDRAIFSQNAIGARRYDRYEDLMRRVAQRLESNPQDVPALLQQASLFLHDSRFEEALAKIRFAHEIGATDETRSALFAALLDGLADDFEEYRGDLGLMKELIASDEDKGRLFRTLGHQLELAGEYDAAFDAYLELSEIDARQVPLHSLSMEWLVRPDRWLRRRTAELYANAKPDQRNRMDQALDAHLSYNDGESLADMRRKLDYFGNLTAAEPLRRRLVKRLFAESEPPFLEIETHLAELHHSTNAEAARSAVADLAELYSLIYLSYAATPYLHELSTDYSDQHVRDNMTGKEFAEFLMDEHVIRLTRSYAYPQGKANIIEGQSLPIPRRYAVPIVDAAETTMKRLQFEVEDEQKLQAVNEFSKLIWEAQISQENILLRMVQGGQRMGVNQHVVVLWTGHHLVGIDALGDDQGGNGRDVLWVQPLVDQAGQSVDPRFQMQCDSTETAWGEQRLMYTNSSSQKHGSRPVIFGDQIVALRRGELVAFDTRTGKELWVRRGISSDSDLFGDSEFVYVATGESLSARCFDAVTGEELPGVSVPRRSDRMAYRGRKILRWNARGADVEIALWDPSRGESEWSRTFPRGVKARVLRPTNELLTLDKQGVVQVTGLDDGQVRLKAPVAKIPQDFRLTVFVDDARYYVGVSQKELPQGDGEWLAPIQLTPAQRNDSSLIFGRLFALDRRTGKLIWEREVQGFAIASDQPVGGPELVMAGVWGGSKRGRLNQRRGMWGRSGLAVLDRRDGSILVRKAIDFFERLDNLQIKKNPAKKEMRIDTGGNSRMGAMTLKWSEDVAEIDPQLDLILRSGDDDRP